ncbi:branched-chain amino acid transaminase [Candidatus Aerophobetes bacterium]|uniref:Branched-chain-amino-acid aminotransferase n=1 Tax=Aerophobetes bacterium TaxID=2030807 RepID=A0A523RTW6_UNCAE|nr:MAG: branched-chain amino acid transaminase [Candidatus Aerophobetes bacterium]
MSGKVWINGKFIDREEAKIDIFSHSLQRGSNIFERIICYEIEGRIAVFRLDDHLDRFKNSAELIRMQLPYSRDELKEAVKETVNINKVRNPYIKMSAHFPSDELDVIPPDNLVQVAIAAVDILAMIQQQKSTRIKPTLKVKVISQRKLHPNTAPVKAKVSANYLSSMLAKYEAQDAGADEAIILDCEGNVAEASAENIFLVKNGVIATPDLDYILSGITRKSVIEIAGDMGIRVEERKVKRDELDEADELFLTATSVKIWPVIQVDDKVINDGEVGEVSQRLNNEFNKIISGKNEKYNKWLTYTR